MTNTHVINNLWVEFRTAINKTYAHAGTDEDMNCLRDYAEDISWSDDLVKLLDAEKSNEKQHRSGRPSVPDFAAITAAKLILMHNACKGAEMTALPRSTAFLVLRKTAVEAEVIGFLCREYLAAEWREAVLSFDYAKLMQAA